MKALLIKDWKLLKNQGGYFSTVFLIVIMIMCIGSADTAGFIISYMTGYVLGMDNDTGKIIIFIMLAGPVITGIITSRIFPHINSLFKSRRSPNISHANPQSDSPLKSAGFSVDRCILSGVQNVIKLGGYIIIFSIICSLTSLILKDAFIYASVSGILEITSGLGAFTLIPLSLKKVYIVCVLSSFGGICTIAQTLCMIQGSGLSIRPYIAGKLINCFVTLILLFFCIHI